MEVQETHNHTKGLQHCELTLMGGCISWTLDWILEYIILARAGQGGAAVAHYFQGTRVVKPHSNESSAVNSDTPLHGVHAVV